MNFDLEEGDGRSSRHDRRSNGNGGGGGDGGGINRREEGLKITLATHALYLAANGVSYMVIQINYQNKRNSPFESHMVMTSSLVALFVYICAATLQIRLVQTNKEYPRLLNHVIVCSGILSLLSNAPVFLSNIVGCIVFVLFVFATTILLAYDVFKLISSCISKRENSENNITHTSESGSGALETTGISHNAATTSESLEISSRIGHNAPTISDDQSIEMITRINNNESGRNNKDAVEMRT